MADLIAYLHARLDEDEAILRSMFDLTPWRLNRPPADPLHRDRLLADVDAKRHLLDLHRPLWPADLDARCFACADPVLQRIRAPWPCPTLLLIAEPFNTHPDFDPSWHWPT